MASAANISISSGKLSAQPDFFLPIADDLLLIMLILMVKVLPYYVD